MVNFRIIPACARTVCRTLLCNGQIMTMQLLTLNQSDAAVEPFMVETAATTFEPSPVMLIKASELCDTLLDDIAMIMEKADPLRRINLYLKAADLYATTDAAAVVIS